MDDLSFTEADYIEDSEEYITEYDDEANCHATPKGYVSLEESQLDHAQRELINEVIELNFLSYDQAIIVLIYFEWNLAKVNDLWYENVELNRQKCGLDMSPATLKTLEKHNISPYNTECLVCYEDITDDNSFALDCKHFFCNDCWVEYLRASTLDLYTTCGQTCPQKGCSLVIQYSVWKTLADAATMDIYRKSLIKNFTSNCSNLKWCPEPKCGRVIQCELKGNRDIDCDCGTRFCFSCGKNAHQPCSCEMLNFWDMKNNSESENVLWIKANTKPCPKCNKNIEKNQGCNHMTCQKQSGGCGHQFCWLCFSSWSDHDTAKCNNYIANSGKAEAIRKIAQDEINKYIFYFDRYNNHHNAIKLIPKLIEKINDDVYDLQQKLNIKFEQLEFLGKALVCLRKTRDTLMMTYVFGYYMNEKSKEKLLFEYSQSMLEKEADTLHMYLEKEYIDCILSKNEVSVGMKEFEIFQTKVTNLVAAALKYQDNLVSEIENKMIHTIDYKKIK